MYTILEKDDVTVQKWSIIQHFYTNDIDLDFS